ncbi:MAG: hypothetical protein HYV63_20725 [Candidatus Schekmanbacteria bacterium]|nr:hypothetical protein [Candidatus Schekmanbacteria bacterium]
MPAAPRAAAIEMCLDELLLRRFTAAEGALPPRPLLRIYRIRPAAITVGRTQRPGEGYHAAVCYARRVAAVRRPTGGGTVLHGTDITISLLVPRHHALARSRPREAYAEITGVIAQALQAVGVASVFGSALRDQEVARGQPAPPRKATACFSLMEDHEIQVDGHKRVGVAMRQSRRARLFQGSVLLASPPADLRICMPDAPPAGLRPLPESELLRTLPLCFAAAFDLTFTLVQTLSHPKKPTSAAARVLRHVHSQDHY